MLASSAHDLDVLHKVDLGIFKRLPASGSPLIAREALAFFPRLLTVLGRRWPLEKLGTFSIVLIKVKGHRGDCVWRGPALGRRYQGGLGAGCKGDSAPRAALLYLDNAWSWLCMWSNARCSCGSSHCLRHLTTSTWRRYSSHIGDAIDSNCSSRFLGGCELACSSIPPPSRSP